MFERTIGIGARLNFRLPVAVEIWLLKSVEYRNEYFAKCVLEFPTIRRISVMLILGWGWFSVEGLWKNLSMD